MPLWKVYMLGLFDSEEAAKAGARAANDLNASRGCRYRFSETAEPVLSSKGQDQCKYDEACVGHSYEYLGCGLWGCCSCKRSIQEFFDLHCCCERPTPVEADEADEADDETT